MSDLHSESYGEGPPLVLVHGLAGSTRWWRRNIPALAEHFKVHVVDLPGFGRSGAACALQDMTDRLPEWMERKGLEKVSLVGHSMGGFMAIHLAAQKPERVERLVLINSIGVPLQANLRQMVGRLFNATPHGSFSFIPTVVSDGLRAGIPNLLKLTSEICQVDATDLMARIQSPTLILWGTRDKVLPPQLGLQMADMIPNATFRFVPGAGHNAMADRPALVNRHLIDFFRSGKTLIEGTPGTSGGNTTRATGAQQSTSEVMR